MDTTYKAPGIDSGKEFEFVKKIIVLLFVLVSVIHVFKASFNVIHKALFYMTGHHELSSFFIS